MWRFRRHYISDLGGFTWRINLLVIPRRLRPAFEPYRSGKVAASGFLLHIVFLV